MSSNNIEDLCQPLSSALESFVNQSCRAVINVDAQVAADDAQHNASKAQVFSALKCQGHLKFGDW